MKGAVHGVASTTASTPVKKSPEMPWRCSSALPRWPMPMFAYHRPDRLRPKANTTSPSSATTSGCCSWKPQPSASPALRSASASAPSAAKLTSTPAV